MRILLVVTLALVLHSPKDQLTTDKPMAKTLASHTEGMSLDMVLAQSFVTVQPHKSWVVPTYATVVAVSSQGLESDFSAELFAYATNNLITYAWDAVDSNCVTVCTYGLYWGTNSGAYRWMAGTPTTNITITVLPPDTNVDTLRIQTGSTKTGPWSTLTNSPVIMTNFLGTIFYRLLVGRTNAVDTVRWQSAPIFRGPWTVLTNQPVTNSTTNRFYRITTTRATL